VQVPLGPFMTRLSTFKLYVDGAQVASKDLNYVVPIGLGVHAENARMGCGSSR
jgi:hypothetical protein